MCIQALSPQRDWCPRVGAAYARCGLIHLPGTLRILYNTLYNTLYFYSLITNIYMYTCIIQRTLDIRFSTGPTTEETKK